MNELHDSISAVAIGGIFFEMRDIVIFLKDRRLALAATTNSPAAIQPPLRRQKMQTAELLN